MNKSPSPVTHITQQQLESYLWGAATLLRGALDESEGDVNYAAFAENHRFLIPVGSHWHDVRNQASNVGSASRSLPTIVATPRQSSTPTVPSSTS